MKNGILPLAEICGRLEHSEVLEIDQRLAHCFREVTDHVRGAREKINSLSARLGLAFEASLLPSQAQQPEISRRLAAWAAILTMPTAMTGIYGMNFVEMPELRWKYGYPMVLSVVIITCLTLFVNFRRAKWLGSIAFMLTCHPGLDPGPSFRGQAKPARSRPTGHL